MDYNEDYLNIGTWELEYIFFLLNSIRAIKVLCWPNMNVLWQHVFLVLGNHLYIKSAKDWVGGSRKWSVSLTSSTVFMLIVHL